MELPKLLEGQNTKGCLCHNKFGHSFGMINQNVSGHECHTGHINRR